MTSRNSKKAARYKAMGRRARATAAAPGHEPSRFTDEERAANEAALNELLASQNQKENR